jgi:hypothetical protein
MTAPAFTLERAAWIREHAWTNAMRKQYRQTPGFYTKCPCQFGPSGHCTGGPGARHEHCPRGVPLRSEHTMILSPGGVYPAHFTADYEHKTDTSATGPQYTSLALVWLADRVCRWICPCDCHTAPPAPVQDALFGIGAPA